MCRLWVRFVVVLIPRVFPALVTQAPETTRPARPSPNVSDASSPTLDGIEAEGVRGRIADGAVAKPGQFPFLVRIVITKNESAFLCTGSVLTTNVVITAGHCPRFGLVDINLPPSEIRRTQHKLIHERLGSDGHWANDIALLYFPEPLVFSDLIQPIRLAPPGVDYSGIKVVLSGWGHTSDRDGLPDTLRWGRSHVVSDLICGSKFNDKNGEFVHSSDHICVAGSKHSGSCHGDSGGPLIAYDKDSKPMLLGLSSFMKGSCEATMPRVYTRVPSYIDWIKEGVQSFTANDSRPVQN